MPQSQILFNKNCFSTAIQIGNDFILDNNYEKFVSQNDDFSFLVKSGQVNQNNLLQNNIDLDINFLYKISQIKNCGEYKTNECIKYEIGLGKLIKNGPDFILHRLYSLYQNTDNSMIRTNGSSFLSFKPQSYIKIEATIPEKLCDFFIEDFSVLVCNQKFTPTPVQLQEKTLLGKLNGTIQSIDAEELRIILTDTNIVDAVETTNKPLSLKSKVVDLVDQDARVSAPIIQARPVYSNTKRPQGRRGMIIYNSETNCFEGFDGNAWRPLLWGDL